MRRAIGLARTAKTYIGSHATGRTAESGMTQKTIGGVLIADALIGIENPLSGKRSRLGLFGVLFGLLIVSVVFFAGQWGIKTLMVDADAKTQGEVTYVSAPSISRSSDGGESKSCSIEVRYSVDGKTYEKSPDYSSGGFCNYSVGQSVEVKYDSSDPDKFTIGNITTIMRALFTYVPLIIGFFLICTLLVRIASLVLGIVLWRRGSRIIREAPGYDPNNAQGFIDTIKSQFLGDVFTKR